MYLKYRIAIVNSFEFKKYRNISIWTSFNISKIVIAAFAYIVAYFLEKQIVNTNG